MTELKRNIHCKYLCARKWLFCLIWLLISNIAYTQNNKIDSLSKEIKTHKKHDAIWVELHVELANQYLNIFPDSLEPLAERGLVVAKKIADVNGMAECMKLLSIANYYKGQLEKAIAYNKLALIIYQQTNNKKGQGFIYNSLAIIFHQQSKYNEAIEYYKKSLSFRQEISDINGVSACYNNIGNSLYNQRKYTEAFIYMMKGLKLREDLQDKDLIANSLNNIAGVYSAIGNYKEALEYLHRAIAIYKSNNNILGLVEAYYNIGLLYFYLKNYEQATYYQNNGYQLALTTGYKFDESLCILALADIFSKQKKYEKALDYYVMARKRGENLYGLEQEAEINIGIGSVYVNTGKTQLGIEYLLKGYQIARDFNFLIPIPDATSSLVKAYLSLNDFKNAYKYRELNSIYNDSNNNKETNKKIAENQFNYELDKKQSKIELLEKDKSIKEEETTRQKYITIGLLSFLIISVFIIVRVINNVKKEKETKELILKQKFEIEEQSTKLSQMNQLKDKTFSILSHDLRSPLGALVQILEMLDDNSISMEEFSGLKKKLDLQLTYLNRFLENILLWCKSHMEEDFTAQIKKINLSEIVNQNYELLHESAIQKQIEMQNHLDSNTFIMADFDQIDLVLRNLLSNAIKFTNNKGKVDVSAVENENEIIVSIKDNGIGMDSEIAKNLFDNQERKSSIGTIGEKGTGLGLLICKEFINKHGGRIWAESEPKKGSTFYFSLPKV
jgi:signal transduction histidine kinase